MSKNKGCLEALVGLCLIVVAISLSVHSCYNYKRLAKIEKVICPVIEEVEKVTVEVEAIDTNEVVEVAN